MKKQKAGLATGLCTAVLAGLLALEAAAPGGIQALEADRFNEGRSLTPAVETAAAPVESAPARVVPMGSVFGIRMFTDGVIVAALSEVYSADGPLCPAKEAGIRPGDYLVAADGRPLGNNADAARVLAAAGGRPVTLTVRRGEETFDTDVTPAASQGSFLTGMWIRDSAAGIGTFTFYDPASGKFAGLGHGICDADADALLALKEGEPAGIALCGIDPGRAGSPGTLKGFFDRDTGSLGTLLANNDTGVYGTLEDAPAGETIEVLPREQVHTGAAEILATVDDRGPRRYQAEIVKVSGVDQRTRNLVVEITDGELLARTGGIVQGMSGCPILQDGKLAGAVTHVFTEDPTRGYGIFAQTMCEELAGA